ncbi:MAG: TlpA family protein disulfide reductase [Piscirickettsiaceae bacterium]|nr:TlpA family protein disulfide reductase [Piscirickettsiaceae bacterium]
MKLRHYSLAILITVALYLINWISDSHHKISPNIVFEDIDGVQHNLSQYQGQPVLLTFWATDCLGCIREIPELIKLDHKFSSQGLTIIAVAMFYDSPERIKEIREHKQLPYLITWDNKSKFAQAFDNVIIAPTHFLIAPNGEIKMRKIGSLNIKLLHKKLYSMGMLPV